jgi:N-acetylmuramoyl-L-alanine amidase
MFTLKFRSGILLTFTLLALCCVSTPSNGALNSCIPLPSIAQKHGLKVIACGLDAAVLRGNGTELSFKAQSRTFRANGILIPLESSPAMCNGKMCIAQDDYISHVAPLLVKRCSNGGRPITIVLDPGHGGRDSGAPSALGLKEKTATLDICKKLAQVLTRHGYVVHMTRSSDTYIELENRAKFANQKYADMFISVHCNAADSKLANGVETFTLPPFPWKNDGKCIGDKKCYHGNKFDAANLALAYGVQRAILRKTGSLDRGIKHSPFRTLRNLNCPGILVECGFLSNVQDRKKLASCEYRQLLAEAIADGIASFVDN